LTHTLSSINRKHKICIVKWLVSALTRHIKKLLNTIRFKIENQEDNLVMVPTLFARFYTNGAPIYSIDDIKAFRDLGFIFELADHYYRLAEKLKKVKALIESQPTSGTKT
jgi:hypothetical protein